MPSLARHGGVHLAAFAVADAADAHRRLAAQGFRLRPLVHMQRPVETGGAPGTAAFTLARLKPGEMPEGRIQILTHRTEHMVWQPRWLSHANGALALTGVTIAVADVAEAAGRFARFTGRAAAPARERMHHRARPRPHRAHHRGGFRAAAAGNRDPVAPLHRRLRHPGALARRGRASVEQCRRAARASTGTAWLRAFRQSSATARGVRGVNRSPDGAIARPRAMAKSGFDAAARPPPHSATLHAGYVESACAPRTRSASASGSAGMVSARQATWPSGRTSTRPRS